jgi:hypothetical protein
MVTFNVDVAGAGLYIDNDLMAASPWAVSQNMITTGFTNPVIIGNYNGTPAPLTSFVGKIDDVAVWNRALTTTEIDLLYTGETTVAGCTNSNSCTFNEGVTIDDGTCAFFCQGCMDPCACNYDQNATTHTAETCVYDCIVDTVTFWAFLDLNINGVLDSDETTLSGLPIHYSGPDSATVFADNNGYFTLPVRGGLYTFEALPTSTWNGTITNVSAGLIQTLSFPTATSDTLRFGLAPDATPPAASASIVNGNWDVYTCASGFGSGLFITNTGGEILSGTLTLNCNPIFFPGPDSSLTIGPDSIASGYAEWRIDSLFPGQSGLFTFHVQGDVDTNTTLDFTLTLALSNEDDTFIYEDGFSISTTLDCAPQPSGEISATPEGIGEGNFITAGETIEYRIAYRNDGPGSTDSLRISLNLNSDEVLIDSFNLLYVAEASVGCLHDDGTLDVYLGEGYSIPDTLEDPIGAMGYIVFEITTRDSLPHGATITMSPVASLGGNPVYIEPYVHRILICDSLNNLYDVATDQLLEATVGPEFGTDIPLDLCDATINPLLPLNYNWFVDNEPYDLDDSCFVIIDSQSDIPDNFTLSLTIANTELDCENSSTLGVIIPVEEFDASHNIQAYPNPFENRCTVVFTEKFNTIVLYNSLGELIRSWNNQPSSIEIDHNQLSSGAYYLVAHSEQRTARKILIAE